MKVISTVCALLITLAVVPAVMGVNEESASIEASNHRWLSAFNRGDTRELGELYTSDAVIMPPSSEILSDPVAIKSYWDGLHSVGVNDFNLYPVNTERDGDTVYQSALWEATRYTAKGDTIRFDGNMYSVLERQKDGSWKIKLQSWN
ncbi:MAG TPA: DUF4440 domain-containing protein [Gammaproteobacteria bacterium]|nr:DUF4440 domain-containing protein [Gammaproteobacteria bacterium]